MPCHSVPQRLSEALGGLGLCECPCLAYITRVIFSRFLGERREARGAQLHIRSIIGKIVCFYVFQILFLEGEHLTPCFCGKAYSFIPRGLSIGLVALWLCIQGVILGFFKDLHWLPTKCVLSPTSMRSSWIHQRPE